ncbi:uncharacterized protein [Arachis hypogaea]|uniref:uncharacterized protein n=1 Tax=Arachis hypogaea TaxID=3818 RepID=UPI000A2C3938
MVATTAAKTFYHRWSFCRSISLHLPNYRLSHYNYGLGLLLLLPHYYGRVTVNIAATAVTVVAVLLSYFEMTGNYIRTNYRQVYRVASSSKTHKSEVDSTGIDGSSNFSLVISLVMRSIWLDLMEFLRHKNQRRWLRGATRTRA